MINETYEQMYTAGAAGQASEKLRQEITETKQNSRGSISCFPRHIANEKLRKTPDQNDQSFNACPTWCVGEGFLLQKFDPKYIGEKVRVGRPRGGIPGRR